MPYIKQERRPLFEVAIQKVLDELGHVITSEGKDDYDENLAKGDLNYIIYSIIKRHIEVRGMKYHRLNDFVGGVMSCCQMELYRKLAAPYEDDCIKRNGDV